MNPSTWVRSSTVVPQGTCLIHGSFVGRVCPTCSSAVQPLVVSFGNVPAGLYGEQETR